MQPEQALKAAPAAAPAVQVTSGLNLWLELRDKTDMPVLLKAIVQRRPKIHAALDRLHYVHYARFVPTPDDAALQVITSFDGDFDAYVLDFVLVIAEEFELILSYVKDRPPSRVKDYPAEFLAFIQKNNLGYRGKGPEAGLLDLYAAYPGKTVIDIVDPDDPRNLARDVPDATVATVLRSDVQANVLRSIRSPHGWHAGLSFASPAGVRTLLAELLEGSGGLPRLSNDEMLSEGEPPPACWLTLGFTYAGLVTLGISEADRNAFQLAHKAFIRGPEHVDTAVAAGDLGESHPGRWTLGGARPVQMVLSVYAETGTERDDWGRVVQARCEALGLTLVSRRETDSIPDPNSPLGRVGHFGYADGFSQPQLAIAGAPPLPPTFLNDPQPKANVGEFLLGRSYPNAFGGRGSLSGLSAELAQNATFAALRVMAQDVLGFEKMLDAAHAQPEKHDREWVAAKLMGRWRNGTPLALNDINDQMPADKGFNEFDYRPSMPDHAGFDDDTAGLRCPVGAHTRRVNPRSALVAGRSHSRRLLRRGMSYGPKFVYAAGQKDDKVERGAWGLFLCADLERQYEFILRQWVQGDQATAGIRGQQDPIIGAQAQVRAGCPMHGNYVIPMEGKTGGLALTLNRLVRTVGSAYLFLPGLSGVRYLAAIGGDPVGKPGKPEPAPEDFDPFGMAFRADPFTDFAKFRASQPVALVDGTKSVWLFSHRHVHAVAYDAANFGKRPADEKLPVGLLQMDAPAHGGCRREFDSMWSDVMKSVLPLLPALVKSQYDDHCRGMGKERALDWMAGFAQPVARRVFYAIFGLGEAQLGGLLDQAAKALAVKDPAGQANPDVFMRLKKMSAELLLLMAKDKEPGRMFDRILRMTTLHDAESNKEKWPLDALSMEKLQNSLNMILTAVLPLQWFIALATWRLLDKDGEVLRQLEDPAISNQAVIAELLRFDMSPPMSERHVLHDTQILGIPVTAGTRLLLCWASASRDEAVFGLDADAINFERGESLKKKGVQAHGWAFGAEGPRNCLGHPLVYAVLDPVIQLLRDAEPGLTLEDGFAPNWGTPRQGSMFRIMQTLNVHC